MTEPRPGVPVPPDDLLQEWRGEYMCDPGLGSWAGSSTIHGAIRGAAWGADEQLRLCVEWLAFKSFNGHWIGNSWATELESAMRPEPPKPLTLKEQALAALKSADGADYPSPTIVLKATQASLIREALETLP